MSNGCEKILGVKWV